MSSLNALISKLLKFAFYLALTGGLVDATLAMRKNAAKAHAQGLISLRVLNHSLQGDGK